MVRSSNPKGGFAKNIKTKPLRKKLFASHTFWSSLLSMRLHCNVRIEMVQCPIRLLAAIPSTLVHSLNFFIPTSWAFVLLSTWDRHKGIHLIIRVSLAHPSE